MNAIDFLQGLLNSVRKADTGRRKPMKVQSLIFSKDHFRSADQAKHWAEAHDFRDSKVDETRDSFRLRQEPPGKFKKYRTIELTTGVKAVVGKMAPTRSDVHVPACGEENADYPAEHKQPVRLSKDAAVRPSLTAGQLHKLILSDHPNVGGTIRTGSKTGSDISPLDGVGSNSAGVSQKSRERFRFGPLEFDIDKARDMGGKEPNAMVQVSPDWSHQINIDTDAALQSESKNPVMIAQVPTTNGVQNLLIDGHHRMFKALHDGKEEIAAHVFSPQESMDLCDTHPDLKDKMLADLTRARDEAGKVIGDNGREIGKTQGFGGAHSEDVKKHIVHEGGKWVLYSHDKSKVLGRYDTKHEAEERERQVQWFKHNKQAAARKPMRVQSLIFSKDKFKDRGSAVGWAKEHDFKHGDVDETGDSFRLRQFSPSGKDKFRTIELTTGVKAVVAKDVTENQLANPSESGARSSGGMGDNALAGMYNMQSIIDGIDWELEHETTDPDLAKEIALSNLEDDPMHYRKLRLMADGFDWSSAMGVQMDQELGNYRGLMLDLGSGENREPGHIGFDLQKHDHGTVVHDLHMGIPVPDGSASQVLMRNSLHTMDELSKDPKPILSEIQRVLMPGGQFVYEGPNQIENQPKWLTETWREKLPVAMSAGKIGKVEGNPNFRQEFTRLAVPDAATANDAEPRIGVAQYDMLPADALLAMDAMGYYWSDATSSGRGNRLHGYPSQGALVKALTEAALTATHEANVPPYTVSELGHRRQAMAKVFKADDEKQIVYGVVLAPNEEDLQGDWMTPEEIEKTAHFFMMNGRTIGKAHETKCLAVPVESYIAPIDIPFDGQYGEQIVKKGSWVLGVKVLDPTEWQKVKDGEYTGFSVGGWGQRTESDNPRIEPVQEQW